MHVHSLCPDMEKQLCYNNYCYTNLNWIQNALTKGNKPHTLAGTWTHTHDPPTGGLFELIHFLSSLYNWLNVAFHYSLHLHIIQPSTWNQPINSLIHASKVTPTNIMYVIWWASVIMHTHTYTYILYIIKLYTHTQQCTWMQVHTHARMHMHTHTHTHTHTHCTHNHHHMQCKVCAPSAYTHAWHFSEWLLCKGNAHFPLYPAAVWQHCCHLLLWSTHKNVPFSPYMYMW